jgi:AcrR family transcriptional regulator
MMEIKNARSAAPGRGKAAEMAAKKARKSAKISENPGSRRGRKAPVRRARADGRETRARVLDAAAEVFARDGFEGASLRRIAETAGIDIATLKYHVRDKPALFAEVYRDGFEHFQQALGPLLMRLPLARDAEELAVEVRQLFERAYDYMEENQRFVRLWLFRLLQGPREVLETEEAIRGHVLALIRAAVEILHERGLLREVDVPVLAALMVTTLPTLMLTAQARPGVLGESALSARQRLIDFAVELVRGHLAVARLDGAAGPA